MAMLRDGVSGVDLTKMTRIMAKAGRRRKLFILSHRRRVGVPLCLVLETLDGVSVWVPDVYKCKFD